MPTISPSISNQSLSWPVCHELRLYDLRHSAATIALAAGVSPKVVSKQLGHAGTAFTLDTYAYVLPHMQDVAAARIEAMLFGERVGRVAEDAVLGTRYEQHEAITFDASCRDWMRRGFTHSI